MRQKNGNAEVPTLEQIQAERKRLRYRRRYRRTLGSTLTALLAAAAIGVLVATLWFPVLEIHGSSMAPALRDGQIVVAVKSSHFSEGDVIAFYHGNKLLVKRCVAGPSDWVNLDEAGNLYVNGNLLEEPYLTEKAFGDTNISLPYQVGDGRWFLVGDNRKISVDSRNTAVGCVAGEQIVGRIAFCIWPLSDFGVIGQQDIRVPVGAATSRPEGIESER